MREGFIESSSQEVGHGEPCVWSCAKHFYTHHHISFSQPYRPGVVFPCAHSADEGIEAQKGEVHSAETLEPHELRSVWDSLHQQPLLDSEHPQRAPGLSTTAPGHFWQGAQRFPTSRSLPGGKRLHEESFTPFPVPSTLPEKEAQGTSV